VPGGNFGGVQLMMDIDAAPAGAAEDDDDDFLPEQHGWEFVDGLVKELFPRKDGAASKDPWMNLHQFLASPDPVDVRQYHFVGILVRGPKVFGILVRGVRRQAVLAHGRGGARADHRRDPLRLEP
jgi:hypothetical protein